MVRGFGDDGVIEVGLGSVDCAGCKDRDGCFAGRDRVKVAPCPGELVAEIRP